VGLTYDAITLAYGGGSFTLAHMSRLLVKVDGKALWDLTGTQVAALNKFYGQPDSAGFLTLWFIRPWMTNLFQQRLTALGTKDVSTLSLEITIGGATTPTLSATAIQSAPQPLGLVAKLKTFPLSVASAGQTQVDSLPRGNARLGAVHLFKADCSDMKVDANGVKILDSTKTMLAEIQTQHGRVPDGAVKTSVDFCLDGDIQHALALSGVQDFRLLPTVDSSGALTIVAEYFDGFDGI
jgi:hypothetical protein